MDKNYDCKRECVQQNVDDSQLTWINDPNNLQYLIFREESFLSYEAELIRL